jgi:hypothetical protein
MGNRWPSAATSYSGEAPLAPGDASLEPPDEPRLHQDLLAVRPQSRAAKVWLQKELFHVVIDLGVHGLFDPHGLFATDHPTGTVRSRRGGWFTPPKAGSPCSRPK